jgi:hypothetical protein
MRFNITKYALAGCATFMVAGCATQQPTAPQYRLTAPTAQTVDGISMLQRGGAQLDAGLDALAIESFRAEIRFNPRNVEAYNGLAIAYGRIGRNDLAQRYFEIALAMDPLNIKVQANLAKLPGNEGLEIQQAVSWPMDQQEPLAITADVGEKEGDALFLQQKFPSLAGGQQVLEGANDVPPLEILDKRGILSSRFAVAMAGASMQQASRNTVQSASPEQPVRVPPLPTERRAPYLQSDIRVGARLERVSLNEVRLITHSGNNSPRRQPMQSFESFGDRIALWLPEYMSAEQAASRYRGDEGLVIMAAVERALAVKKMAAVINGAVQAAPDFAYIFYDSGGAAVGT